MENLTHSLTGYMMHHAGLKELCPNALPVLLMAVNLPDIDIAAAFFGDLAVLEWRRGLTHSVILMFAWALAPLLPMLLLARRRMRWKRAYAVSLLGVASHLLLDWTNSYGVRFLAPFSGRRFHLDLNSISDLWILAVLLLAAGWILLSKLVSSEIGAKAAGGRAAAITALLLCCFWVGGRYLLHERAVATLDSRIYQQRPPLRAAAFPRFASPFHWTGVVETGEAHHRFEMNLLDGEFDPEAGRTFYKPEAGGTPAAVRETRSFRSFLAFARFPVWRIVPADEPEGAARVEVTDLRFGVPHDSRFMAAALVDGQGRLIEEGFHIRWPGGKRPGE